MYGSEPRTSPAGHSFKEAVLGPKDNNMSSIVKRIQLAKDGFLRSRLENCCVGKAKNFHVLQNAWDILKNNDKSKCNANYEFARLDIIETRPPMLYREGYVSWKSRIMTYLDTKPNGKHLIDYILKGPYHMKLMEEPGNETQDPSSAPFIRLQTKIDLKHQDLAQFLVDKEALHILLIGLPDVVYQTLDAAKRAREVYEKVLRQIV
ncbi:hypothetical protein Tco_1172646 [Tanacetum coccineum]